MKNSWIHITSGELQRQARVGVPHGLSEEHISRQDFAGQTAMIYHCNPPTKVLRVSGTLVPMACEVATLKTTDLEDAAGGWLPMLAYRPGDFVHIPKGLTYRHIPDAAPEVVYMKPLLEG